jgi:predicted nucleic acid-binding protein
MQRRGIPAADTCRRWAAALLHAGIRLLVPEIVDYELRRELVRLNLHAACARLDSFLDADPQRLLPLYTSAIRHAAQLWATLRQQGFPTASPDALDIDVLLAAQVLTAGLPNESFTVATTNVIHINRLLPAALWTDITFE